MGIRTQVRRVPRDRLDRERAHGSQPAQLGVVYFVLEAFRIEAGLETAALVVVLMAFSLSMQVGVTAVNTAVGLAAVLILFRSLRPVAALRAASWRSED